MYLHIYVYIEMYVHFSYICGVKFFPEKENHLKENCIKEDDFEKSGLLGA